MVNGVYTLFIPSILLNLVMFEPVKIFVSVGFNSKQQQKTPKNHVESVVKNSVKLCNWNRLFFNRYEYSVLLDYISSSILTSTKFFFGAKDSFLKSISNLVCFVC